MKANLRLSIVIAALFSTPLVADGFDRGIPQRTYDGGPCLDAGQGDYCYRRERRIVLPYYPQILSIKFFAHDDIGSKTDGKLNVYVDGRRVGSNINIKSYGRIHELTFYRDRYRLIGKEIVFRAVSDDVQLGRITVKYRPRGGDGGVGRDGGGGGTIGGFGL